jgi:hypothetical protein
LANIVEGAQALVHYAPSCVRMLAELKAVDVLPGVPRTTVEIWVLGMHIFRLKLGSAVSKRN